MSLLASLAMPGPLSAQAQRSQSKQRIGLFMHTAETNPEGQVLVSALRCRCDAAQALVARLRAAAA